MDKEKKPRIIPKMVLKTLNMSYLPMPLVAVNGTDPKQKTLPKSLQPQKVPTKKLPLGPATRVSKTAQFATDFFRAHQKMLEDDARAEQMRVLLNLRESPSPQVGMNVKVINPTSGVVARGANDLSPPSTSTVPPSVPPRPVLPGPPHDLAQINPQTKRISTTSSRAVQTEVTRRTAGTQWEDRGGVAPMQVEPTPTQQIVHNHNYWQNVVHNHTSNLAEINHFNIDRRVNNYLTNQTLNNFYQQQNISNHLHQNLQQNLQQNLRLSQHANMLVTPESQGRLTYPGHRPAALTATRPQLQVTHPGQHAITGRPSAPQLTYPLTPENGALVLANPSGAATQDLVVTNQSNQLVRRRPLRNLTNAAPYRLPPPRTQRLLSPTPVGSSSSAISPPSSPVTSPATSPPPSPVLDRKGKGRAHR